MEDLTKDDLLNAGFTTKKGYNNTIYWLDVDNCSTWLCADTANCHFYLYDVNQHGYMYVRNDFTKERLDSMYIGLKGNDLDFSPKKSYSWDEEIENMSTEDHNNYIDFTNSIPILLSPTMNDSFVALLKLIMIIEEINEDYPRIDDWTCYPFVDNGKIALYGTYKGQTMNHLGLESTEGYDKLIQTNTPLLKQYFMI